MIVRGRATAYHALKEPSQLKFIYEVVKRGKYCEDIKKLAINWAKAIKNGEVGRFRVTLEVSYKAALYVYDWGKRYRVCSVSINAVPDILIKLHKGA